MPRPARADHPADPGVQADAQRRRVLARQREEPAAAADLRHRLGEPGALKAYLERLEEAERRDHRKLGAELDLFTFPEEIGSGPAGVPPQGRHHPPGDGGLLRQRHEEAGYSFVNTPHITKGHLFETSGHLPYYADSDVPADGDSRAAEDTTSRR